MKKIILLFVFISNIAVAEISLSGHEVINHYVIESNGVNSALKVSSQTGYDFNDSKKSNEKTMLSGNVDARIPSKESYDISLSYQCIFADLYKYPENNFKNESISLSANYQLIKKYGLDNEKPYYFTFSNKHDSFTVLSGERKKGYNTKFEFKWEVATKVRKLLQSDDELKVIVRNSNFPNLSFYFDGFKKGYDKINDCLNAK